MLKIEQAWYDYINRIVPNLLHLEVIQFYRNPEWFHIHITTQNGENSTYTNSLETAVAWATEHAKK